MKWQDKPTKDGYYWLHRKGLIDDICEVCDMETVYFIGSNYEFLLRDIEGLWYGPLSPPK